MNRFRHFATWLGRLVHRLSNRDEDGFSLTELMIVVSVMGLLIALTTPAWQKYIENSRLMRASDGVSMKLLLARQKAVTEGNDFILVYDVALGTYRLHDDDNNNGTYDAGEWRDTIHYLPPGVSIYTDTFSTPAITFSRNGSSGETGNMVLKNGRGGQIRISVTGPTGRVRSERI